MKHIGEITRDIELPNSKPTKQRCTYLKEVMTQVRLNHGFDEHDLMYISGFCEDEARRVREKSS